MPEDGKPLAELPETALKRIAAEPVPPYATPVSRLDMPFRTVDDKAPDAVDLRPARVSLRLRDGGEQRPIPVFATTEA